MVVGEVTSDLQSVATTEFLTIQPATGVEWVIHNIYHEAEVELYFTDGTNDLKFDSDSGKGVYAKFCFHLTNTHYLKVKNTNAESKLIGYDGVVTK